MPYLYVALSNNEGLINKHDMDNLIEKHSLYLTEYEYGHLKIKL